MKMDDRSKVLHTPYLTSTESEQCWDKESWEAELKDMYATYKDSDYAQALMELESQDLWEWWKGWSDPKGFGATMKYNKSIYENIAIGMAYFNSSAKSYLCGIADFRVSDESPDGKVRVELEVTGIPTEVDMDDLEMDYADEIRYRFPIPKCEIGFIDGDPTRIYLDFDLNVLKG